MARPVITLSTTRYVAATGHKPRMGRSWWFRLSGSTAVLASTVGFSGRYRQALRQARRAAKQLRHTRISVVAYAYPLEAGRIAAGKERHYGNDSTRRRLPRAPHRFVA